MKRIGIPVPRIVHVALPGLMLLMAASCALMPQGPPSGRAPLGPEEIRALEMRIHEAVNRHRVSVGLQPLAYSERIAAVARKHSRDMAAGKVPFGHSGFQSRFEVLSQGISGVAMGENVGVNDYPRETTARMAVNKWLESSGHRECLEDAFHVTGVGVAADSRGNFYYTQIFLRGAGS